MNTSKLCCCHRFSSCWFSLNAAFQRCTIDAPLAYCAIERTSKRLLSKWFPANIIQHIICTRGYFLPRGMVHKYIFSSFRCSLTLTSQFKIKKFYLLLFCIFWRIEMVKMGNWEANRKAWRKFGDILVMYNTVHDKVLLKWTRPEVKPEVMFPNPHYSF